MLGHDRANFDRAISEDLTGKHWAAIILWEVKP